MKQSYELRKNISERIKQAREQKNLGQTDLAEKIHVSVKTVRQWEAGQQVPRADHLWDIADTLHVTMDWLLGIDGRPIKHRAPKKPQSENKTS